MAGLLFVFMTLMCIVTLALELEPYHEYSFSKCDKTKIYFQLRTDFLEEKFRLKAKISIETYCSFDGPCAWKWSDTASSCITLVSQVPEFYNTGRSDLSPVITKGSRNYYFLFAILLPSNTVQRIIESPQFGITDETCALEFLIVQQGLEHGLLQVIVEYTSEDSWIVANISAFNYTQWTKNTLNLGKIHRKFSVIFQFYSLIPNKQSTYIGLDNLRMVNCFAEKHCEIPQQLCTIGGKLACIDLNQICDLRYDCDQREDEFLNCDKIPPGGRCDFENDLCGWYVSNTTAHSWTRGAYNDDPFVEENTGYYMYFDMNSTRKENGDKFYNNATLTSPIFNPPPSLLGEQHSAYYNSCAMRFKISAELQKGSVYLQLVIVHMQEKENITISLWMKDELYKSKVETVSLNVKSRYYLQFLVSFVLNPNYRIIIDNISLSPQCFGINIPTEQLNGYDYWKYSHLKHRTHKDFQFKNYLKFESCDNRGRNGPTQSQCETFYTKHNPNTVLKDIQVISQSPFKGFQRWKVPHEGFYTFIVRGASGGVSSIGIKSTRGAEVVAVMKLLKNEELYLVVGQQGEDACPKSSDFTRIPCPLSGGGGGGGSFVFLLDSDTNDISPLLVAGGGGGGSPFGVGYNVMGLLEKAMASSDFIHIKESNASLKQVNDSIFQGGKDGRTCLLGKSIEFQASSDGGFGGGESSGCFTGGHGGGHARVDIFPNSSYGQSGSSYIDALRSLSETNVIRERIDFDNGSIIIIPATEGCGCDYLCIALDETALANVTEPSNISIYWILVFVLSLVFAASSVVFAYKLYQRRISLHENQNSAQNLQLRSILESNDEADLSNYGLIHINFDVERLSQLIRGNLSLIKVLGRGAFGEVYQGLYRHKTDEAEIAVAVKTLPEISTRHAVRDFLLEAVIMANFDHPNIVRLIGVCFDSHPKFIVLELLEGGDLKNFLREVRQTPNNPSPLTIDDLVQCAIDVAKGCEYMENRHFIHRDLAARNCLLSTRGPKRAVKIADFGMARDIYSNEYYRKEGKAMLPVKWMPPEALFEGIFTSKTDVWSFGVLLWEVFSLGLAPFIGLSNSEVMEIINSGGRLGAPPGCPSIIYEIMIDCWNPIPEDRPTFFSILERLNTLTL
uniref:Tyrosine-protein kinase receptor n=1 Tax=Stomoxys calcitrans TaxID=35570 RepID=A0A1I8Q124_STOCA